LSDTDAVAIPALPAARLRAYARAVRWSEITALIKRTRASGDLWYLVAAMVVNIANFAFFGLVAHLLPPSAYGTTVALLNVVSIAAIPLNALQAAVVRETVLQSDDGVIPDARRAGIAFAIVSLCATMLLALASPAAARFFGIASVVPLLLLALWFAPAISSSLYDGLLIGTLRWRPVALSLVLGAVVRVGVGLGLGVVDPTVTGPIVATLLNAIVTLGVVLCALARDHTPVERPALLLPMRSVLPTVAVLTGYSMLVAADAILARHILTPRASGNYAAAVTVGRIALFIPMMLTVVIFPRFVAHGGRGPQARRLLLASLAAAFALGLATAAMLTLLSHPIVTVLFGHRYARAESLIGLVSLEGALLGAMSLLTYFHLARRSYFSCLPAIAIVTAIGLVLATRPDARALALTMVLADAVCVIAMTLGALIPWGAV
jgi:O-antigen/teichoic acid export membrane protein